MKPIEEDARRQLSLKLKSKFYGRCMTYLLCSINSDDSLYNGGVLTSQPTLREWTSQIRAKTHTHTHHMEATNICGNIHNFFPSNPSSRNLPYIECKRNCHKDDENYLIVLGKW